MKIAIASDIHLEMGDIILKNTDKANLLVLAGDIFVANNLQEYNPEYDIDYDVYDYLKSYRIHKFFFECSKEFEHIILVAGNHEHYHGDFDETSKNIKKYLKHIPNLTVLDKESVVIDDVKFVGGTLWTDMNNNCNSTKEYIKRYMNDFRAIKKGHQKFTPDDARDEHIKTLYYFNNELRSDKKTVVVTHHAPSPLSIASEYKDDELMNGGYCSDLENFIKNRPFIQYWIHGHTHNKWNYIVGNTRVICNPRGYKGERTFDEFELKYVEI